MAEWLASLPLAVTFTPPFCPEHHIPLRLEGSGKKFHWSCRDERCAMRASFSGTVPQCPVHRETLLLRGSGLQKMLACPQAKKERCPVQVTVHIEKVFAPSSNSSYASLPLHASEAITLGEPDTDGLVQQRLEGLGFDFVSLQSKTKKPKRKLHPMAEISQVSMKSAFVSFPAASPIAQETITADDTPSEWMQAVMPKTPYRVKELTQLIQSTFQEHAVLGKSVVVEGELSNVKRSSRGHIYFTLKDEDASIGGILWAGVASRLNFDLADGQAVYLTGKLEIYGKSGTYSLVASKLEPVGMGALQLTFEQIKARLEAEGLFMEDFKKPLPEYPARIGLITSSTGAVIHDMLRVIRRKNRFMDVLLYPVKVQGDGAADDIARAITELNHSDYNLDALIVARGGGSFEDLFCFSEESVVRAVFNSRLPIVTGIGHEPDFSLADAAADYSASTPTAAADWLTPDAQKIVETLDDNLQELTQGIIAHLQYYERTLDDDSSRLVDLYERRLDTATSDLDRLTQTLLQGADAYFLRQVDRLGHLASNLDAFNPLQTLGRGFAIATGLNEKVNQVIYSVEQAKEGSELSLRLSDGRLIARVLSSEKLPLVEQGESSL
jgi:exodeoxyribonuclease VII large subunit